MTCFAGSPADPAHPPPPPTRDRHRPATATATDPRPPPTRDRHRPALRHPALRHPARQAQPLEPLHRLGGALGQGIERLGGEAEVVDRHAPRLQGEATEPAHGGALVASRVSAPQHEADSQRVVQGHLRQLARGSHHQRLVASLQGAAEARVGIAVASHANVCSPNGRMNATTTAKIQRMHGRLARSTLSE